MDTQSRTSIKYIVHKNVVLNIYCRHRNCMVHTEKRGRNEKDMQSRTAKPRLHRHLELHDGIRPRLMMRMKVMIKVARDLRAEVDDDVLHGG